MKPKQSSVADSIDELIDTFFSTGAERSKVHTLTLADPADIDHKERIEQLLLAVEGVSQARLNPNSAKVHVLMDGEPERAVKVLEKAGFAVLGEP